MIRLIIMSVCISFGSMIFGVDFGVFIPTLAAAISGYVIAKTQTKALAMRAFLNLLSKS